MEVLERRPAWEGEAPQPEVQDDIVSAIARLDDGELQIVHSDLLLVKLGATCWHPIKALRGLAQASDLVLVSQLEQPSSADAAAALLTVLRSAIFSPMQVDEAGDEETAHMALASFHRSADCRLLRPLGPELLRLLPCSPYLRPYSSKGIRPSNGQPRRIQNMEFCRSWLACVRNCI